MTIDQKIKNTYDMILSRIRLGEDYTPGLSGSVLLIQRMHISVGCIRGEIERMLKKGEIDEDEYGLRRRALRQYEKAIDGFVVIRKSKG